MDGENRRHPRAGPERSRHPPQRQEQDDRGGGVQEHVGQVVATGLQSVEIAVQHVREPGQRVPVERLVRGDCPGDCLTGQAVLDVCVVEDVVIVVEVDDVVADRLAKDDDHRQHEQAAHG